MQPPLMPDDGHTTRVTSGADTESSASGKESVPEPIWDDDDTRTFYESLPDLRFVSVVQAYPTYPFTNFYNYA